MRWLDRLLAVRRPSASHRLAADWEGRSRRLLSDLKSKRRRLTRMLYKCEVLGKRLDALYESISTLRDEINARLETAETLERHHQTAIEALRAENQVLNEVTVPTLVNQHKLIMQRCDADLAVQTRRQVAAGANSQEDM
jgi:chromosome segregation ATPase